MVQPDNPSLDEEIEQLIASSMEGYTESELFFTIYYNSELQKLSIHLEHITNLPTVLPEDTSHSYVQIYLLSRKFKEHSVYTSHVVMKTHQPRFDYMATFNDVSMKELESQDVVLRIYMEGESRHFLGGVVHPLQSMNLYGSTVTAKILTFPEEEAMKVTYSLYYLPSPPLFALPFHSSAFFEL
jgi:hypothetical protein